MIAMECNSERQAKQDLVNDKYGDELQFRF